MPGADHSGHEMKGFLGPYGMGREGSGTSWQPDNSPHPGIYAQYGEWMTMWHALLTAFMTIKAVRAAIPRRLSAAW
jgi:hypothetical protein